MVRPSLSPAAGRAYLLAIRIWIALASKDAFACHSTLAVAQVLEAPRLLLYVTYVVFRGGFSVEGPCSPEHAIWQEPVAVAPGVNDIVVVVNGFADRFPACAPTRGVHASWLSSVRTQRRSLLDPIPRKFAGVGRTSRALEMLLFPEERLPAC